MRGLRKITRFESNCFFRQFRIVYISAPPAGSMQTLSIANSHFFKSITLPSSQKRFIGITCLPQYALLCHLYYTNRIARLQTLSCIA